MSVSVSWPVGQPAQLRRQLLQWYDRAGRAQLPWLSVDKGNGVNDYAVAVSELMMQQTTVAVGLKRFPLWMEEFPTWEALAAADSGRVMKAWEGLGYYARARSLHKMAKEVVTAHHGRLPLERSGRLQLPGVGPTTASAMGAFVHGLREPIWDANVNRVWKRWWGASYPVLAPKEQKQWEWEMAQQAMPSAAPLVRKWTQAIMDLGATVCTPKPPKCLECPWRSSCAAFATGSVATIVTSKPKIERQTLWKNWVWEAVDGKVAVVPPTVSGVWAGLWQLPEVLALPLCSPPPLNAQGKHTLSHRDVHWSVAKVPGAPQADVQWVEVEKWGLLALPKPLRAWWDGLSEEGRKRWTS